MENGLKTLIISDGRVGHQSQSEAFCKLLGYDYELVRVEFSFKWLKFLSYVLDFCRLYSRIFRCETPRAQSYDIIVSAGSTTYYANKFFARKFKAKNVALMLPKGFRNDFSLVFSAFHDASEHSKNLITLPVSINFPEPKSYYKPKKKAIGIIIGGSNKIFAMSDEILKTIEQLRAKFAGYEVLLTTSPRTPKELARTLSRQNFDFFVDFELEHINPIYDFLTQCEFVFITQDSVSMISEAVCNGSANIVVLPLKSEQKQSKFHKFIENLESLNLINVYQKDAPLHPTEKLNLNQILSKVKL